MQGPRTHTRFYYHDADTIAQSTAVDLTRRGPVGSIAFENLKEVAANRSHDTAGAAKRGAM